MPADNPTHTRVRLWVSLKGGGVIGIDSWFPESSIHGREGDLGTKHAAMSKILFICPPLMPLAFERLFPASHGRALLSLSQSLASPRIAASRPPSQHPGLIRLP